MASAEPHLTANADRCELINWARMRIAGSGLATKKWTHQEAITIGC